MKDDTISRQEAIKALGERPIVWAGSDYGWGAQNQYDKDLLAIETVPPAQPEGPDSLVKDSQCLAKDLVNDCISRQAAITQLSHNKNKGDDEWELAVQNDIQTIWKLPAAQPETHDKRAEMHACDLISRQALCEYALNQKDKNITANDIMRFPSAQPESAKRTAEAAQNVSDEDLISRKEAIDAVCKSECEIGFCGIPCPEVNALKVLPPAQPERQKGEWIDYTEDGYVECPFCHNATNCDGNKDELHFCFSCGADMRGVDDEYNQ